MVVDGSLLHAGDFGLPTADVLDPANGSLVGSVAVADQAMVDAAVRSADAAFPAWAALPASARAARLLAISAHVRRHADELALVLTREQGKPLSESRGELTAVAKAFDYYAAAATRVYGSTIPTDSPTIRSFVARQPIGVVAAIITWNYPLGMFAWKVAPALAAGCTVVAKPALDTPLSTLLLAAGLVEEELLPPGVLNVIAGTGGSVGDALARHPLVRKITFTGGTETGRHLLHLAADTIKRTTLELGGGSPMIVAADADLDRAVVDGVRRAFRNTGQLCNSVDRLYVHSSVADTFVERFVAAAGAMTMGHGLDSPEPDLGPLSNVELLNRVEEQVADAVDRGATLAAGGRRPDESRLSGGNFFPATVLDRADDEMRVVREEIFGPVVPLLRFDDIGEAIDRANSLESGLVAYLYTRDLRTAHEGAERLEFGTVNVNNVQGGDVPFPYSGWKQSGLGVELSEHGLDAFLELKHIRVELDS